MQIETERKAPHDVLFEIETASQEPDAVRTAKRQKFLDAVVTNLSDNWPVRWSIIDTMATKLCVLVQVPASCTSDIRHAFPGYVAAAVKKTHAPSTAYFLAAPVVS